MNLQLNINKGDHINFEQWLKEIYKKVDAKSLFKRSVDHYISGPSVVFIDMLNESVISKKLSETNLMELDFAISIIMITHPLLI